MNKILIIRPGAIGDALLTFPVLKALKERYTAASITLVSNAQVLPLAQAFGIAEETSDFQDIRWSELFSSHGIRTSAMRDLLSQTDLAICWIRDLDGIIEYNLKTSGAKHLIIAPGRPPAGENLHIVDYLARTIGLPDVETQFIAHKKNSITSVGARVDEGRLGGPLWSPLSGEYRPLINEPTTSGNPLRVTIQSQAKATKHFDAIHPGSGAAEKCWPISHFAEVIKRLWEQNHPVLLLSGPADTERIDDLMRLLPFPPTPEMLKLLTHAPLVEVAHQLYKCRCYLGNDSGITHLAAMLGVPTVAIFSPTDPKIWRPLGPFVKVLRGSRLEDISEDAILEALNSYSS